MTFELFIGYRPQSQAQCGACASNAGRRHLSSVTNRDGASIQRAIKRRLGHSKRPLEWYDRTYFSRKERGGGAYSRAARTATRR